MTNAPGIRTFMLNIWRPHRWLVIFSGASLVLIGVYFLLTSPDYENTFEVRERLERDLKRSEAEVSKIVSDLDLIREQLPTYKELLENGWLARQDRLQAAAIIEQLAQQHDLAYLDYQFQPERRFTLGDPKLRETIFVETGIKLNFKASLDLDIKAMILKLQTELPGAVEVAKLDFGRSKSLELPDLLALEAGQKVSLIQGSAVLFWRTLEIEGMDPINKKTAPDDIPSDAEAAGPQNSIAENENS